MNLPLKKASRRLQKAGGALLLASVSVMTANAEVKDFGEIVMGQTYHFEQNDEVMATYTAPETSIYIFSFTGTDIPCFNEPEHVNPTPHEFFYGSNLESCRAMPLEAGQTVYLYSSSLGTMSAGTMTLLEPPSTITLDSMSPELSTDMKLSASTDYRATFFFSTSVTATSGSIRFEDGSYTPCALSVVGSSVQIGFSDQIMTAYREGKIKDGDTVTIRIVGIKSSYFPSVRYEDTGRLDVPFKVYGKPLELVGTVNAPDTGMSSLLSYYVKGDPAGILTLEFDGEIDTSYPIEPIFAYGDPEDMEHPRYFENVPYAVDGNKIHIDFTDKLRRPSDMIPGITPETAEKTGVLQIGGIRSSDGQRAYTGSMATFASFIYVYPLQTLAYTFAADYVPAKGSSVKGGSPVEIWIMNGAHLVHEGLEISYVKDGQSMKKVLSAEELKITTDPDDSDAMLINFDMPQIDADDMSEIQLRLNNAAYGDGLDHDNDIMGRYVWDPGTSADEISADSDTPGDVFTATGICVMRQADRKALRNLPAGIYLHNGRKIIVK